MMHNLHDHNFQLIFIIEMLTNFLSALSIIQHFFRVRNEQ